MLLKRTDFVICQRHTILSKLLEGPAGIALPWGGDAYWFLVKNQISRKWYKTELYFQWQTDRKLYNDLSNGTISMILNGP